MWQLNPFVDFVNHRFLNAYHTILIGGFTEPFYLPATNHQPAQIQFTHDYFRSALHELAHWCEAGNKRRQLPDYGYWYAPDGRTPAQQQLFFNCEITPQAFEWALALVCEIDFEVSIDNLTRPTDSGILEFTDSVYQKLLHYIAVGFPQRLEKLLILLYQHSNSELPLYDYLQQQLISVKK
ncbi:MAG: hypothetical protein RL637_1085 [Pseudomonadota bacterium]|jgi:elongation factor P hydroxylase